MAKGALLDIRNLQTHFFTRNGKIRAVDNVSLTIGWGKTLGLIGESGCGKSVTARSIMGLIPSPPGRIVGGEIFLNDRDLLKVPPAQMPEIRGNEISMIFQEPMTSLNPVFSVGEQVSEVIKRHQGLTRRERREKLVELLKLVGIPEPEKSMQAYPHQLSGGMRQRIMIAMAVACNPKLMIADEPTTALDVTIQAQILDLMEKLKEDLKTSILFITHDLGVISEIAEHMAVMYAGKIVEIGNVDTILEAPAHPYTAGLMNSLPSMDQSKRTRRLRTIPGSVPSLTRLPDGCAFQARCERTLDICRLISPPMDCKGDRKVWCHLYA